MKLSGWERAAHRLGRERLALIGLVTLHLLLGLYYSAAIPIWEAHDEIGHYYFVRYLATEHRLPPPGLRLVEENDELHQPPLYYLLTALPVSLVGAGADQAIHYNPHLARPQAQGGYNRVIHDPAAEGWPYRGLVLGVHVARVVSVLLGALGVLFTFLAARQLSPGEPWVRWGAALLLALWPQYRFTTAVVNNDIMVTVCVAAATWLLLRAVAAPWPRPGDLLGLGVATGLAALSKGNGLALAPAVFVAVLGCAVRAGRRAGQVLGWLAGSLVLGGVVVGWWYGLNLLRGAGVLGGRRTLEWLGRLLAPLAGERRLAWRLTVPALGHGLRSLWAGFGWNNVGLPLPLYWLALAWALLALVGLGIWLRQRPPRQQVAGVAGAGLIALAMMSAPALASVSAGQTDPQGRVLLAGLPAVTLLLARGWTALLPVPRRGQGWAVAGGAMALLALAIPVASIGRAYALPRRLSEAELAGYTLLQTSFGGCAELVGYRLEREFVDPGQPVRLSLAWRALERSAVDYTIGVQLFTGEHELLGDIRRFPGRGTLATSSWEPGYLFAEEVAIPAAVSRPDGPLAWLELSLYDHRTMVAAPAQDGRRRPIGSSVRLGRVRLKSAPPAARPAAAGAYRFGQAISLVGCRTEGQSAGGVPWLDVDLHWTAAQRPEGEYTVSLQLRDEREAIVAQADGAPRQGQLPTLYWLPGESVADRHTLFLPADLTGGEYRLYLCLYELQTMERLPVRGPRGEPPAGREVKVARVALPGPGQAPAVRGETQLAAPAAPVAAAEVAGLPRAAVEAAVVDGLRAADRELDLGHEEEALRLLQEVVLALDPHSLPGLYRRLRAEGATVLAESLRHFELESVAVPTDGRLALYLGEAMAALVEEGIWTRGTLHSVVACQVWRSAQGREADGLARLLQSLLHSCPGDPDLLFLEAERCHRGGDLERARAAYEHVLAADADYREALLRLGAVAEAQGRLQAARERYVEYRRAAPGDLLGLKRLSAVSAALGTDDAPALAGQLAAKTDDRRLAAELLGVPVEAVEVGPNLVENGGFEEWVGERPRAWDWSRMFSQEPYGAAVFVGAGDPLDAFDGQWAARVDGLWKLSESGQRAPRAGFCCSTEGMHGGGEITVAAGAIYMLSMEYRTARTLEGRPGVWLSSDAQVMWDNDHALELAEDGWRHLVAVAWNRKSLAAGVRPMVRSHAVGTVQFDDIELREVKLWAGAEPEVGEARFMLTSGLDSR